MGSIGMFAKKVDYPKYYHPEHLFLYGFLYREEEGKAKEWRLTRARERLLFTGMCRVKKRKSRNSEKYILSPRSAIAENALALFFLWDSLFFQK
jgi:hypothetical protein